MGDLYFHQSDILTWYPFKSVTTHAIHYIHLLQPQQKRSALSCDQQHIRKHITPENEFAKKS